MNNDRKAFPLFCNIGSSPRLLNLIRRVKAADLGFEYSLPKSKKIACIFDPMIIICTLTQMAFLSADEPFLNNE
ncbi:hypothetical protein [Paenibacillus sp. TH7-28]